MKKILLSLAVLFISVVYVNAQSFTLTWDGEVLDDTVSVFPDSVGVAEIVFDPIFHNHTSDSVYIKVIRTEWFMLEGTSSYFCWGACYPPFVDTSGSYIVIPGGGESAELDFSGHYVPDGAIGSSLIEYVFYDMNKSEEFVMVLVNFDTSPDAIDEYILNNIYVSDIYPNPAINFVNIDYTMPAEVEEANVKIVNLLGSVVSEQDINTGNNQMRMNISGLNSGIYFYSININGEIYSTKKLVVK